MITQENSFSVEHISLTTGDGLLLPGLHYSRSKGASNKKLLVYVHGAGSSSILRWPKLTNTLAQQLIESNIDMLSFNNRGAGYITKFDTTNGKSVTIGMTYEHIADSKLDIEAALDWADKNSYTEVYLYGHSTGANKLVLWANAFKTNHMVVRLILSGGGDDVSLQLARYTPRLLKQLKLYTQKVSNKQLVPAELFPGDHPISVASLLELTTANSDYDIFPFDRSGDKQAFQQFKSVKYPVSIIYGDKDFGTIIPIKEAIELLSGLNSVDSHIIPGAGHNYINYESELAKTILKCIDKNQSI